MEWVQYFTGKDGSYRFDAMPSSGNYMLKPEKNDGLLEGVSTLDVIMIQRHILGAAKILSPYRLVAADVNNDDKISASDLVELKKAILGTTNSFKNNKSWKMIDSRYKFPIQTIRLTMLIRYTMNSLLQRVICGLTLLVLK